MANKRTVIAPDEELLIQGQLTVVGNVVQVEDTTIITNFENDVLIINSDGTNSDATLSLNKNGTYGNIVFEGGNIEFNRNITFASTVASPSIKGNVIASDNAVLLDHVAKVLTGDVVGDVTGQVSDISNHDTSALAEDPSATTSSGTMYFTDARSRASISVTDTSAGQGTLTYNSGTGVITYTGVSDSQIKGLFSATDAGGDGSFAYNSGTGVFTYTGPSASEVRAHFSASNGVDYNSSTGAFQAVETEIQHDSLDGFVANEHIDHSSVILTAGAGLTGTGDITASRTFDIGQGDGITVNANDVAVDSTVVRTSSNQTIAGTKTFSGELNVPTLTNPSVVANNYTSGDSGGSTKAASTAYVEAAISSLINGAPGTLNTLSEISNAINDDANVGGIVTSNTTRILALEGVTVSSGNGLSVDNSAILSSPTLSVNAGDGISVGANIDVDSTVVRTSGDQSLADAKTFTGTLIIPDSSATANGAIYYDNSTNKAYIYFNGSQREITPAIDAGDVEDVGATGTNIYAGTRLVGNVTYHGIKSIGGGTYTSLSEASNVITIDGNISAIRSAFSAVDNAGDGTFSYNATTGVFSYSGVSQSQIRSEFSAGGDLTYDSSTGEFSFTERTDSEVRGLFSASGLVSYDSATGAITTTADNYANWQFTTGSAGNQTISSNDLVTFAGSSGISVTHSGSTITITGQNGDITDVVAGNGLTGGASSGSATLNVGAGTGITVNADDIEVDSSFVDSTIESYLSGGDGIDFASGTIDVDSTVVRTTGNQSIGGDKTLTGTTQLNALNINSEYTLPTSDGSSNQVLTTNGSGTLSFQSVSAIGISAVTGGDGITATTTLGTTDIDIDLTDTAIFTDSGVASKAVKTDGSGDIYANVFQGTATSAQYADLAENYLADAPYAPGTVVEFGGDKEVTAVTKEGSPAVAGVISTDPAHLMNSALEGDNVVAVALRGRVPCKVYGPVKKGDVLIASNHRGLATAAPFRGYQTPAASIVGKAISDHKGMAEGVVEILV